MNKSLVLLALGVLGIGCLSRPVGDVAPTTKVAFTNDQTQLAVDKVDLLFAIDNSASMGDKQAILKEAVPNLIEGLLEPPCIDEETRTPIDAKASPFGNREDRYRCPEGSEPLFKPVTDMHIGIISSSLGNMGGNVCRTDAASKRTNDGGKLVNIDGRGGGKDPKATLDFLAWYPPNDENKDKRRHPTPEGGGVQSLEELAASFQNMVVGVDQNGCGLEAQLESVYRFLVQPDPWVAIPDPNGGQASLGDGIDFELLEQRAKFLRPDSLVAVVMLTDEDDSSADPLALNGFGWAFMSRDFPNSSVKRGELGLGSTAPRGTSVCASEPGSPDCTSCAFGADCDPTTEACQKIRQDPSCTESPVPGKDGLGFDGFFAPADDDVNVRFHRMKQRYGVDPQYPIRRYVDGFTKPRVPDRATEHPETTRPDGRRDIAEYAGTPKCTNPLFAAKLPQQEGDETCDLPKGSRSPDLVFFAVVGGVPNGLLQGAAKNNRLTDADWVKILGKNPDAYDDTGIDEHMLQSVGARAGLRRAGDPDAPRSVHGSDEVHGREWNTNKRDLQYACTFDLVEERDCSSTVESCDCNDDAKGQPSSNAPLCKNDGSPTQVKAKAYPSIRPFRVVRALGERGIAASLCPLQLTDKDAPTYGYKPAVAAIVDRLSQVLITQCLPQALRTETERAMEEPPPVPCLVLAQLDPSVGQTCAGLGLEAPAEEVLRVFREQQAKENGIEDDREVCQLKQKVVRAGETCAKDGSLEWCYVEKAPGQRSPAGTCPQALIFADGTAALTNARFTLQCINQFSEGEAANGAN
ncbi:MAG: hypothetical protein KIT84_38435 [Labilithrix sp.]|nr:hypothetical protein [Labilithrix sp.]MCW5816939.1 hypothetical protein [Labilithrix sp.]